MLVHVQVDVFTTLMLSIHATYLRVRAMPNSPLCTYGYLRPRACSDDDNLMSAGAAPPTAIDGDVLIVSATASATVPDTSAGVHPVAKAVTEYPLITGTLQPGDSQTVLMNNMHRAPLFRHVPRPCDFLLIVFKKIPRSAPKTGGGDGGDGCILETRDATTFGGRLREITSLFVAGQLEILKQGVVRCLSLRRPMILWMVSLLLLLLLLLLLFLFCCWGVPVGLTCGTSIFRILYFVLFGILVAVARVGPCAGSPAQRARVRERRGPR